jgi:hypothetical protein
VGLCGRADGVVVAFLSLLPRKKSNNFWQRKERKSQPHISLSSFLFFPHSLARGGCRRTNGTTMMSLAVTAGSHGAHSLLAPPGVRRQQQQQRRQRTPLSPPPISSLLRQRRGGAPSPSAVSSLATTTRTRLLQSSRTATTKLAAHAARSMSRSTPEGPGPRFVRDENGKKFVRNKNVGGGDGGRGGGRSGRGAEREGRRQGHPETDKLLDNERRVPP